MASWLFGGLLRGRAKHFAGVFVLYSNPKINALERNNMFVEYIVKSWGFTLIGNTVEIPLLIRRNGVFDSIFYLD